MMSMPLDEFDRQEMLADLERAHEIVSVVSSKLEGRYAQIAPALKACAKTKRQLFQLKREIAVMDLDTTPRRPSSPVLRRGKEVVDLDTLRDQRLRSK